MTDKTRPGGLPKCIPSPLELKNIHQQLNAADRLCPLLSRPGVDTALMPAVASPDNQPDTSDPVEIFTKWQEASDDARHYLGKVDLPENTANQVMHFALKEINSNPEKIAERSPTAAILEILRQQVTDLGYAA